MALAETSISPAHSRNAAEPTLSSSLEHLVSSSQSVITRRIDLALLEAQEIAKSSIEFAGFYVVAMVLAACTWLAGTSAAALFIIPFPNWAYRLGVFALLNALGAVACVLMAKRHAGPAWTTSENTPAEPATSGTRS